MHHLTSYLLIAALAVIAALLGLAFAKILYATEDLCDKVWGNRPEWARPAAGGIALGLLLLALPQMYGVGYPVMYKAVGGSYALWFLIVLAAGKIIACSLTIGIGGSGGVFAPSLFIGATSGMAFGEIAGHLLGPAAGQPALYAVVAMGAVFASAARAPLTSVASVVEMTGDYTLTLPVLLAVAIATATSRALSYGTIYTIKLLRRGIDIDRAPSADPFQDLTAADAMRPFPAPLPAGTGPSGLPAGPGRASLPGPVTHQHHPQVLFANESLTQALRQLELYGRDGLPVIADDGQHLQGWITTQNVLQAVARHIHSAQAGTAQPQPAAGPAPHGPRDDPPQAPAPLGGYQVLEITIAARLASRRPPTRRHRLAARLDPGLGPGQPHPARPRPRHHPSPRRPRQPARPHPPEPRASTSPRRTRQPARQPGHRRPASRAGAGARRPRPAPAARAVMPDEPPHKLPASVRCPGHLRDLPAERPERCREHRQRRQLGHQLRYLLHLPHPRLRVHPLRGVLPVCRHRPADHRPADHHLHPGPRAGKARPQPAADPAPARPPRIEVSGVPTVGTLRSTAGNAGLRTPAHLRLGALGTPVLRS